MYRLFDVKEIHILRGAIKIRLGSQPAARTQLDSEHSHKQRFSRAKRTLGLSSPAQGGPSATKQLCRRKCGRRHTYPLAGPRFRRHVHPATKTCVRFMAQTSSDWHSSI